MKNVLDEKLANQFASSPEPAVKPLLQRYNELNLSALAGAEKVSRCCKSMRDEWNKLLPILHQMQSLLSERGADHGSLTIAGLPTWSAWLKHFLKESGLDLTMRAVQKQLAKLRGSGKRKAEPSDPPLKLSAWDQKRLIKAAQCGNELIVALEAGGDYSDLMREYKEIGMDTEKIDQLLNAIQVEPVQSTRLLALPGAQATENTIDLAAPVTPGPVSMLSTCASLPKAGDGIGLANYISEHCDMAIKAVFGGLDPVLAAECIGRVMHQLDGRYCTYDRRNGQIKAIIDYVPADTRLGKQAA